jgi:hypothetical protein
MTILGSAQDLVAGELMGTLDTGILAAGSFGKTRVNSGSHSEVKGGGIALGLGKGFKLGDAGIFAEFGKSDFDTYNGDYHGEGDGKYYGLGVLGRYRLGDTCLEGSLRAGKTEVSRDSIKGGYQDSAIYVGGHLGAGYKLPVGIPSAGFTIYGKYLYGHTGRMQGVLSGLEYQFKAVDSHRSKLGIHTEYGVRVKPYLDLAWEHEFSGEAKAIVTNLASGITAPSIKGDTGVLELGCGWQKYGWYSKLGVSGTVGVRRGISGVVRVGYNF